MPVQADCMCDASHASTNRTLLIVTVLHTDTRISEPASLVANRYRLSLPPLLIRPRAYRKMLEGERKKEREREYIGIIRQLLLGTKRH